MFLHYTFLVSIAAGMAKIEAKNQQIQTEIVKTVEQHVQVGSTTKQQGVYSENKSVCMKKKILI